MARKLKGRHLTGKGLKGALQKHQVIEKTNGKQTKSLLAHEQRCKDKTASMKSGARSKKNSQKYSQQKKSFIPFDSDDSVLLVGEGDFTFARSLVTQGHVSPENLIATSFDTYRELINKYPAVQAVLNVLKEQGVVVLHGVDCTKLAATLNLNKKHKISLFSPPRRLNIIMFNFPHTGRGMKDVDRNIRDHQKLVLAYFKNCKEVFDIENHNNTSNQQDFSGYNYITNSEASKQKIILSLFDGEPYISWGVKALARSVGYCVERSGAMDWAAHEGYHHMCTNGIRETTKPAVERDARIYVFDKSTRKEYEKLNKKTRKMTRDGYGSESD